MGVKSTVMEPVSVCLKNLDSWEIQVLDQVVQMEFDTERGPLAIKGNYATVGDVVTFYVRLQRAYITE